MFDEDQVATGEFPAVQVELDNEGNPVVPRVTDEWIWAMQSMARLMQKSARFRVETEAYFRPVPDIVKETVQSAAGIQVAPTISSLYDLTDGFEFEWSYDRDGEFVPGGRVHLFGFAEVFGSWLSKLWGEHAEDAPKGEQDFTWEIRAFDGAANESPYQVVMHTPEVLPTYSLYWYAPTARVYRLTVDFMEYLSCLAETRGLHNWQYMVCDVDLEADADAKAKIIECTRLMKSLFPMADLSRFITIDEDEDQDDGERDAGEHEGEQDEGEQDDGGEGEQVQDQQREEAAGGDAGSSEEE